MRKFTPEQMAQADACDQEKVQNLYPYQNYTLGDTSPDGRMLESNPMYEILQNAKKKFGV